MSSASTDPSLSSPPSKPEPRSAERAWPLAVAAVVLFGGGLRFLRLGHESFWYDEAYTAAAVNLVLQPRTLFNVDYINDAPLFHFVVGFWSKLVGVLSLEAGSVARDFAMRMPSAVLGSASVFGVYWLVERVLHEWRAALFAAFIFSISPFQIFYAQDLRPYAMHVALNIVAAYFLVRSLENNRPVDWVMFVVACTLGIYNHFIMVFYVVAMNVYFVVFFRRHFPLIGRWIAANLAIIVLASPALAMMLHVSGVFESADEDWYPVPGVKLMLITFKNYFAGYSRSFVWYRPLSALAALFVVLGVWNLRREPKKLALLLILGAVPPSIAVIYWSNANFPYYTHRLMIFSGIPVYALAASGITVLPKRSLQLGAIGLLTALTLPALADYYAQRPHPIVTHTVGWLYKADSRSACRFIKDQWHEGDVVVHRLRYTAYPFRYYMGWESPNYVGVPTEESIKAQVRGYPNDKIFINTGVMPQLLDDVIAGKKRVWYVDSWWRAGEQDGVAMETVGILASRGKQMLVQPFDALTVYMFDMSQPPEGTP